MKQCKVNKENIGIEYMDYYIPDNQEDIKNLIQKINSSKIPESFKTKEDYLLYTEYILGLKTIRIENDLNDNQMLSVLLKRMFEQRSIKPEEIDLLVICREPKPNQTENLGQYLMLEHNLENAHTISWSGNQCCNLELAIHNLTKMMEANDNLSNVLVLSSIKIENNDDRIIDTYGIYGDGAGLVHLSKNPLLTFIKSKIITENKFYNIENNKDVAKIHAQNLLNCVKELFAEKEQIDKISQAIVQNANVMLVTQCLISLGLEQNKIFKQNLSKYGHLDCIDFVLNLKDYMEGNNQEEKILTIGLGFNGTYIGSLYEKNEKYSKRNYAN